MSRSQPPVVPPDSMRAQIVDILGLETSPDGHHDWLLTYDEKGNVLEGSDWADEVDELVALFDEVTERHKTHARVCDPWMEPCSWCRREPHA